MFRKGLRTVYPRNFKKFVDNWKEFEQKNGNDPVKSYRGLLIGLGIFSTSLIIIARAIKPVEAEESRRNN